MCSTLPLHENLQILLLTQYNIAEEGSLFRETHETPNFHGHERKPPVYDTKHGWSCLLKVMKYD